MTTEELKKEIEEAMAAAHAAKDWEEYWEAREAREDLFPEEQEKML